MQASPLCCTTGAGIDGEGSRLVDASAGQEVDVTETDSEYWARYYAITGERPPWATVVRAIELFASEEGAEQRFAVDLGCGGGRDARELLKAGWRVLAIDREAAAIAAVEEATLPALRPALEGRVADLAEVEIPRCDLVNASLSLPFLAPDAYWGTWARILAALPLGGRFAALLFGDKDGSASDPSMTCPPPAEIRARLGSFEIEHWVDREEDTTTALGEPHYFHIVELVARRVLPGDQVQER
jgi:SAM-dependent methyltransferase